LNTGNENTAVGQSALVANTTGSDNTGIGYACMNDLTTAASNTAIGYGAASGNFNGSVILGKYATATASNQFVVGSASVNAGTIATEVLVSDRSWAVRINGTDYKILLKA
jgi:hypothetical protein